MATPGEPIPLFEEFPAMEDRLARLRLCDLPTPVDRASGLEEALDVQGLYIKRDDITGKPFGGNKVRKLEFLLGDAKARGAKEVITFGYAGSNHALATAVYAAEHGLHATSMLLPQPNAHYVRRNLLAGHAAGAQLILKKSRNAIMLAVALRQVRGAMLHGRGPTVIPPGGSSPLGAVGFVNAALELKQQIDAGDLPAPDRVYLPFGSMGTAAGLALGFRVAGVDAKIHAVRVVPQSLANLELLRALYDKTNALLHERCPTFPVFAFDSHSVEIRAEFFGEQYGLFTEASAEAIEFAREKAGLSLEGTYSGKAFSAMRADAAEGRLKYENVLFWDTYNSRDLFSGTEPEEYFRLPKAFHRFFENEVQPLDR